MTEKEILKKFYTHAKKNSLILNKDKRQLDAIVKGFKQRYEKYKKLYCICRFIDERRNNADIECPCIYSQKDIKRDGHCHCFLFFKKS